jgi:flagellar biosynthesis/type III secretory pathway protein FliH
LPGGRKQKTILSKFTRNFRGENMQDTLSPRAKLYISIGEKKGKTEGKIKGFAEGMTKGFAEGMIKGLIEAVISILDVKFGGVSETFRKPLNVITDIDYLQELKQVAKKCDTIDEFNKELKSVKQKIKNKKISKK